MNGIACSVFGWSAICRKAGGLRPLPLVPTQVGRYDDGAPRPEESRFRYSILPSFTG